MGLLLDSSWEEAIQCQRCPARATFDGFGLGTDNLEQIQMQSTLYMYPYMYTVITGGLVLDAPSNFPGKRAPRSPIRCGLVPGMT